MSWWKWWKRNDHTPRSGPAFSAADLPIADISLDDMKSAIREYEDSLPKGVNRTVLLDDNQQIDHRPLAPYLRAIPNRPFYMSRETFEVFEEEDKWIPYHLDRVQHAVDWFIKDHRKWPTVTPHSPKINFRLLIDNHYLKQKPPFDMYMTDEENMVTHVKPESL